MCGGRQGIEFRWDIQVGSFLWVGQSLIGDFVETVCGTAEKWTGIKENSGSHVAIYIQRQPQMHIHTHKCVYTQGSQWCGLHWLRCPSCRGPSMGWGGQEHYPAFVKERVGMSNKSHLLLYLWNYSLQGLCSIRLDRGNHNRLLAWTHIYSVVIRGEGAQPPPPYYPPPRSMLWYQQNASLTNEGN